MTLDIALVLTILTVSILFLITEWIPMEITALLTLGVIALTGIISPAEALSGFSNPAVVTIWAVFILSGGLTKTGVANQIGKFVLRYGGSREISLIVMIMTTAGVMSAIMNNVAVAALMLPVVMDICKQTKLSPSKLLMPLAYGTLLGGLTTLIGTPPNILVTDALRETGLPPFRFFDFTPVGLLVMSTGVIFMALVGRHLLPKHVIHKNSATAAVKTDWRAQYELEERLFYVQVPESSSLIGKSLAEIRFGSILGWNVLGISREQQSLLAPGPGEILQPGDLLTIEGRIDAAGELKRRHRLIVKEAEPEVSRLFFQKMTAAEIVLAEGSEFVGNTLNTLGFRGRFGVTVLALRRGAEVRRSNLQDILLHEGDCLLVAGCKENRDRLRETAGFSSFRPLELTAFHKEHRIYDQLMVMEIAQDSSLVGSTIKESRLGEAFGGRIFSIMRDNAEFVLPEPLEVLQSGDRLLVDGSPNALKILSGLEDLEIVKEKRPSLETLMTGNIVGGEAMLSPQTMLEGKTMRQINFREKFGLYVLALWRKGYGHRSDLRDIKLRFGDVLLLYGDKKKLKLLARDPDFIVLTETVGEELRQEKMMIALLITVLTFVPVFFGLVPIFIAAVFGAAFMVVTGCLTMEEAYRRIEWKAVFLIAGMLPLGMALDQSGAAKLIAERVVAVLGPLGPTAVMFGIIGLTFMATCFVPTAALVVLMAPIVFNTSAAMGLSPHGLLMAVAMSASASFMTPVAHPANILIMGPGGYRFMDYVKVGGLLTLVIYAILMLALPLLWPLAL